MFNSLFMVLLAIDGGSSCSYSFLRAMSIASFSGTFVYKIFKSRDIKFSLGSRLVLTKISLATSELVSMYAPSIFSKNFARILYSSYNKSYQARRGPVLKRYSLYALSPTHKAWRAAPSRPHPCVEIFTYFVFFPHSQQLLIDVSFYLQNNRITCSFTFAELI